MKIRIGNDIKLRLQLILGDSQVANIVSAQAYIINNTAKEQAVKDLENKTRFLSRFPAGSQVIDPKLNGLEPSEYNINMVGDPTYNVLPHEHKVHEYDGIGVYPDWDKKYTKKLTNISMDTYNAVVKFTETPNIVEVEFPAEAQLYTGEFTVVLVTKIFKEGYSIDNTATVTADYSNIFTLVPTGEEGQTGPVTIDATQTTPAQNQ